MRSERHFLLAGRSGGKIVEIGPVPLARVKDMIALAPHRGEDALNGLDGCARGLQIVTHAVDVAALSAEIHLHVDNNERGILRTQVAIVGPRIWFRYDCRHGSFLCVYLQSIFNGSVPLRLHQSDGLLVVQKGYAVLLERF